MSRIQLHAFSNPAFGGKGSEGMNLMPLSLPHELHWESPPASRKGPDRDSPAERVEHRVKHQYSSRNINVVTDRSHSVMT
jgi:hypothetical protein